MAELSKLEGPRIQLDFEGKSLYLLDRLFDGVSRDNPVEVRRDYFVRALFALARIYGKAREGAPLWYRNEALRFRGATEKFTEYDPTQALRVEGYDSFSDGEVSFDTEGSMEFPAEPADGGLADDESSVEPESDRVPIFPIVGGNVARLYKDEIELATEGPVVPASPGSLIVVPVHSKPDGPATWHDLILDAIEAIPDVPGKYAEPSRRARLYVVGRTAEAYLGLMHHADRLTGDPVTDLMLTAVCIGNGLRDLQREGGEFYFEPIDFPVPEPVVFLSKGTEAA